jgi:hypothetical protein
MRGDDRRLKSLREAVQFLDILLEDPDLTAREALTLAHDDALIKHGKEDPDIVQLVGFIEEDVRRRRRRPESH